MRCGEVRRSILPEKKVMKKYCRGGREWLVHAGSRGFKNNYSPEARRRFHDRHNCSSAKFGTPRELACKVLWGRHNKFDTKR